MDVSIVDTDLSKVSCKDPNIPVRFGLRLCFLSLHRAAFPPRDCSAFTAAVLRPVTATMRPAHTPVHIILSCYCIFKSICPNLSPDIHDQCFSTIAECDSRCAL